MGVKRTVLVVDDQEVNRDILSEILSQDYNVISVEDGIQAIEVLKSKGIEISAILLDLVMPKMDGVEVLKVIKKDFGELNIPIIVETQKYGDTFEVEILKLGANDFVTKPYNPDIIRLRVRNLIEMREARAAVDTLVMDEVTGLLTKVGFSNKAQILLEDSKEKGKYELIVGDIEQFKLFNDIYGEDEVNRLLRYIADSLKEVFEGRESLIAHGYGDRFFILTAKYDDIIEDLNKVVEKVREFKENYKAILKFGIYTVKENVSIGSMCDRAQLAVDTIKGQYDKYCCYYDASLREKMMEERKITNLMRDGLKEKQFDVYFQPKFDANRESIVGAEALVRWIHPEIGMISPGIFIPIFEKNGFITELDKYVWERVCEFQSKTKKETGVIVPVSINVSRRDILEENLVNVFSGLLSKYDIEAKYLHLEITESAYTENPQQLISVVKELKDMGFVIEMDDFGSGYSSLNMLAMLPIDILKLDMKFIQNEFVDNKNKQDDSDDTLSIGGNSKSIISTIINLARWMNLLVVAEGVETKEQLEFLKKMKCNIIQGYYFAKPMVKEDFRKSLEEKEVTPVFDMTSYMSYIANTKNVSDDSKVMLIVDDLDMNRIILEEYFKNDYHVVQSDNGKMAWEYIKQNYENITIIMLDLYMPAMDGFTLLEMLKADEKYKNIPVVITSQASEKAANIVRLQKADGFLSKPYQQEEALQVVMNTLNAI